MFYDVMECGNIICSLFPPAIISPTAPTPPSPLPVVEPPPVNPRERIQLAKIGKKYIVIEDVEPLMEEWDLRLWKGMRVDGRSCCRKFHYTSPPSFFSLSPSFFSLSPPFFFPSPLPLQTLFCKIYINSSLKKLHVFCATLPLPSHFLF